MSTLTDHCSKTNHHSGTPTGEITDFLGFKDVYVTGNEKDAQTKGVIVIFTDIFGVEYINNKLVADSLAKGGYFVVVPDLFEGGAIKGEFKPEDREPWFAKHSFEITIPFAAKFLEKVEKELKPKGIYGVGHCYGAKLVFSQLTKEGYFKAGAVAHPSGTTISDFENLGKALLISAAEVDPAFSPDLRLEAVKVLLKKETPYKIDLFSGTTHGFAVRADPNDPVQVFAAKQAALDQITWFDFIGTLKQ